MFVPFFFAFITAFSRNNKAPDPNVIKAHNSRRQLQEMSQEDQFLQNGFSLITKDKGPGDCGTIKQCLYGDEATILAACNTHDCNLIQWCPADGGGVPAPSCHDRHRGQPRACLYSGCSACTEASCEFKRNPNMNSAGLPVGHWYTYFKPDYYTPPVEPSPKIKSPPAAITPSAYPSPEIKPPPAEQDTEIFAAPDGCGSDFVKADIEQCKGTPLCRKSFAQEIKWNFIVSGCVVGHDEKCYWNGDESEKSKYGHSPVDSTAYSQTDGLMWNRKFMYNIICAKKGSEDKEKVIAPPAEPSTKIAPQPAATCAITSWEKFPQEVYCQAGGEKFPGNGYKDQVDQAECEAFCVENPQCAGYLHRHPATNCKGQCHIRPGKPDGTRTPLNCVYGPAGATYSFYAKPTTCPITSWEKFPQEVYCQAGGEKFPGNGYKDQVDQAECEKFCVENPECAGYLHRHPATNCKGQCHIRPGKPDGTRTPLNCVYGPAGATYSFYAKPTEEKATKDAGNKETKMNKFKQTQAFLQYHLAI